MPKTIKAVLMDALEDLNDTQLKKFRHQLTDRREEPYIRKGTVQNADRMDLADIMVSAFTEAGVIRVAGELLRAIGCNDIAIDLEKSAIALESSGGTSTATNLVGAPESSGGTSSATNIVGGKHFVDHHRNALIQRVNNVAPILDDLLDKNIINHEGYNIVMSKATNQEKMRELFQGPLNSSGTRGKDVFYAILVKREPFLMDDLKLSV